MIVNKIRANLKIYLKRISKYLELIYFFNTVKAFVVIPSNDTKFHNFNRGYDKDYKFL